MIMEIVSYGHPSLRAVGRRVEKVDPSIRRLVGDMLETMVDADGVGLAAQQVGMPLQLCVVDITGVKDRPSNLWIGGVPVDPESRMPLILINPEIELSGKQESGTEGCLSFPGLLGEITRPERVKMRASGLDGESIELEATGLLSRAIQHEYDHLQGVLFIDRMEDSDRREIAEDLDDLLDETGGIAR